MLHRAFAGLYFLGAVLVACRLALVMPLFQNPDEGEHFLRAVQVGQGGLLARRATEGAGGGGRLPRSLDVARNVVGVMRFEPHAIQSAAMSCAIDRLRWASGDRLLAFANTAVYPPFFYVPEAVAIDLARLGGMSLPSTVRLARIVDAVLCAALGALSILVAGSAAPFIAAILSLPMTLSLFASCSQDALLIAITALAAGFLSGPRSGSERGARLGWALSCVAFALLATARPPYAALLVIPVAAALAENRKVGAVIAGAGGVALLAAWTVLNADILPPTRAGGGLLLGHQAGYLARHVGVLPSLVYDTAADHGAAIAREFVGVLGWLTVVLSDAAYAFMGAALALAAVLSFARQFRGAAGGPGVAAATLLAIAGSAALMFLLEYLSWTALGARSIDGVQGRYFIPLALAAAVLGGRAPPTTFALLSGTVLVLSLQVMDLTVVVAAVRHHFTVVGCGRT
jgi:hypothetical protein